MNHSPLSVFNRITLTAPEQIEASKLSSLQRTNLNNLLCNIMEEKLNLPFTPNNPLEYAQREAHLKGQMDILNYLIAMSDEDDKSFNFTTE